MQLEASPEMTERWITPLSLQLPVCVCTHVCMLCHLWLCAGALAAGLLLHPGHGPAGRLLLHMAVHGLHEGALRGEQTAWDISCFSSGTHYA
jgi:hypothetical protein